MARTEDFIKNIHSGYFEYCADIHIGNIKEDETDDRVAQNASIALRTVYSQSLETLFALLFSLIRSSILPVCLDQ